MSLLVSTTCIALVICSYYLCLFLVNFCLRIASSKQRDSASLPSPEPSAPQWKYDVFLSFRGEETRKGIAFEIYDGLKNRGGIETFMDEHELQAGSPISPTLLKAIEESRFAIIVLSPNYASSPWCLEELTKIVECMKDEKEDKNKIMPLFYHVEPADVRYQKNSFEVAFTKHEATKRHDRETVKQWRDALKTVANCCGWDTQNYKTERELVEVIVESVCNKVGRQMAEPLNLQTEVDKLSVAKATVAEKVTAAYAKGENIHANVQDWLNKVDDITKEAQEFLKDEIQATEEPHDSLELLQVITELYETREFSSVSYVVPAEDVCLVPPQDYQELDSRASTVVKIMDELRSPNSADIILVHGIGGAGKTTLAEEVLRQAEKEKLFDDSIMVRDVKKPNLEAIQKVIADKLGLNLSEIQTTAGRADKICDRVKGKKTGESKQDKKTLVILDDVWEEIDFKAVGLPHISTCRILLTSRTSKLFSADMINQKPFPLGVLGEDETWILFEKRAGNVVEGGRIRTIATKLAQKCGGLPLLVVTVASSLRDKTEEPIWSNALRSLEEFDKEEGLTKKTYLGLEWSYTQLNENLKPLFLVCGTIVEGNSISLTNLLKYGMGLGFFKKTKNVKQARDLLYTQVRNLKDSSLLLDGDDDRCVRMHDLVHHVGRQIASRDHHVLVQDGADDELKEWTEEDLFRCRKMSLPCCNIATLPQVPWKCPELEMFHLHSKGEHDDEDELKIFHLHSIGEHDDEDGDEHDDEDDDEHDDEDGDEHDDEDDDEHDDEDGDEHDDEDGDEHDDEDDDEHDDEDDDEHDDFARDMHHAVNKIASGDHPSSRDILSNFFEEMKNLKVLGLNNLPPISLPPSLQCLKNLQTLCLDGYMFEDIALVGELTSLQVLSIVKSKVKQLPKEIGQLTRLRLLDLSDCSLLKVISPGVISNLTSLEDLRMRNSFDKWEGEGVICETSNARVLELKDLSKLTALEIRIPDANILPPDLFSDKLERYQIYVGDAWVRDHMDETTLNTLKLQFTARNELDRALKMLLKKCDVLSLDGWMGLDFAYIINTKEVMFNLTTLSVYKCDGLKCLLSSSMAQNLKKLKHLEISDCKIMEQIISTGEHDEEDYMFGDLKSLELKSLPNLARFCTGKCIEFPLLEELIIDGCTKLGAFVGGHMAKSNRKLETRERDSEVNFDVHSVGTSRRYFLFDEKVRFPRLETLHLDDSYVCDLNYDMLGIKEDELQTIWHNQLAPYSFGRLRAVNLKDCDSLRSIFPPSMMGRLNALEAFGIICCKSVEVVFDEHGEANVHETHGTSTTQLKKISVHIKDCCSLKSIFPPSMTGRFNPLRASLHISRCDSLEAVFDERGLTNVKETHGTSITQWKKISVHIEDCRNLKSIFPPSLMGRLSPLQASLHISSCDSLEAVFDGRGLTNVKETYGISTTQLNKISVHIEGCRSLTSIFTLSMMGRLNPLQASLHISSCDSLEAVFGERGLTNVRETHGTATTQLKDSQISVHIEGCRSFKSFFQV